MVTQELKAGNTLNFRPVDMEGCVCATLLPEVHNELFGLGVKNGIRTMYRCAVVGEEGVEERTQRTALWDAGVQDVG